jgi:gliding motility associated protien GldN
MKIARILIILSFIIGAFAPVAKSQVLDGLYVKEHTPARKPIPYPSLREADVMWNKRIWRYIDLKEKMNHPLYYPTDPSGGRASLFEVIRRGVNEGTLLAFDPLNDDFRKRMTIEETKESMTVSVPINIIDEETGDILGKEMKSEPIESKNLIGYEIKEDWFFDKQRSVLDVRIIGIAPIIMSIDPETGAERSQKRLFWLYYPNCREIFANSETFNRANDAERRTYEDIFWKRMFSSYITKESNVYDRKINEYTKGLDALLEAERIKHDIFNMEMDMWHY